MTRPEFARPSILAAILQKIAWLWVAVFGVSSAAVAACGMYGGPDMGSYGTPEDAEATDDDASGADTGWLPDTVSEDIAVTPDTVSATCSITALAGTWVGTMVTLTFNTDGTFHAVGANRGMYDVTGTYAVTGCQISLTDLAGVNPCPASQTGVYTVALDGGQLQLSLVSDACQGRVKGASGKAFTKQVPL